jgi:hypothetical protein
MVIATLKRNVNNPSATCERPTSEQNTSTTKTQVNAIGSNHKELNSKRFRMSAVLVESNPQIGTIGDLFNCG